MKRLLFITLLLALTAIHLHAEEDGWLTDFEEAIAAAKKEDKLLLMDFIGSDWCPFCQQMQANVYDKPEFKEFAKENLILLHVDFPKRKKLPSKQRRANDRLLSKYKVKITPTIVLLNSEEKVVHKSDGYNGETVDVFIANLKKVIETNGTVEK